MTVHTSSREDVARYPGQDTLYFFLPMMSGRSLSCSGFLLHHRVIFVSSSNTTWSHTLCTDAKETGTVSIHNWQG